MYPVSDSRAVLVAGEALVDAVVLASRLIVRQYQSTSANHLLDAESIDDQRLVILRPPIPGPHTSLVHSTRGVRPLNTTPYFRAFLPLPYFAIPWRASDLAALQARTAGSGTAPLGPRGSRGPSRQRSQIILNTNSRTKTHPSIHPYSLIEVRDRTYQACRFILSFPFNGVVISTLLCLVAPLRF